MDHNNLLDAVHYDPESGIFTRLKATGRHGRNRAGAVIGSTDASGYRVTTLEGRRVYLHRLAVFYMTGAWPPEDVDHRDTDRSNNRWQNLRCVSRAVNCQNRRRSRKDRVHGSLMGVKRHRNRWQARINDRFLGSFATEQEAHSAYLSAKRSIHEGCTL